MTARLDAKRASRLKADLLCHVDLLEVIKKFTFSLFHADYAIRIDLSHLVVLLYFHVMRVPHAFSEAFVHLLLHQIFLLFMGLSFVDSSDILKNVTQSLIFSFFDFARNCFLELFLRHHILLNERLSLILVL